MCRKQQHAPENFRPRFASVEAFVVTQLQVCIFKRSKPEEFSARISIENYSRQIVLDRSKMSS